MSNNLFEAARVASKEPSQGTEFIDLKEKSGMLFCINFFKCSKEWKNSTLLGESQKHELKLTNKDTNFS